MNILKYCRTILITCTFAVTCAHCLLYKVYVLIQSANSICGLELSKERLDPFEQQAASMVVHCMAFLLRGLVLSKKRKNAGHLDILQIFLSEKTCFAVADPIANPCHDHVVLFPTNSSYSSSMTSQAIKSACPPCGPVHSCVGPPLFPSKLGQQSVVLRRSCPRQS